MTNSPSRTAGSNKLFDLEAARKRQSYVQGIAADIVRLHALVQEAVAIDLEGSTEADSETALEMRLSAQTRDLIADLERCKAELEAMGIKLKSAKRGTVHFLSTQNGEIGYYCWHPLTEKQITRWHAETVRCDGTPKTKDKKRAV